MIYLFNGLWILQLSVLFEAHLETSKKITEGIASYHDKSKDPKILLFGVLGLGVYEIRK
jgi:hypothetical protein